MIRIKPALCLTCSTEIRLRKVNSITDMYATLGLGQKTVRAVLKRQNGKIVEAGALFVSPFLN